MNLFCPWSRSMTEQARKPRSYASSKLYLTDRLTRVKCRAFSAATNLVVENTWTNHPRSLITFAVVNAIMWTIPKIGWLVNRCGHSLCTWYLFLSQGNEHCPWWNRLELFQNENSSWKCRFRSQASWTKKYQKWYTIDALGVIFAICSNFDSFNVPEIISKYLQNISKFLNISQNISKYIKNISN